MSALTNSGHSAAVLLRSANGHWQPLKPLLLNAFSTAFKNSALHAQNDDFPLFGHYLTFIYAGIAV